MFKEIQTAFALLGSLTILTGIIYPLSITGIAQWFLPHQANGSLIYKDDQIVGSELLGQYFSHPGYFWGRLSATSPTPNNSGSSSGSNFGQLHPNLMSNAKSRMADLRKYDDTLTRFPIDLVTASASGLDPHISLEAARLQSQRVALHRGLKLDQVLEIVNKYTSPVQFGFLGQPRVPVLQLNLELDRIKPMN